MVAPVPLKGEALSGRVTLCRLPAEVASEEVGPPAERVVARPRAVVIALLAAGVKAERRGKPLLGPEPLQAGREVVVIRRLEEARAKTPRQEEARPARPVRLIPRRPAAAPIGRHLVANTHSYPSHALREGPWVPGPVPLQRLRAILHGRNQGEAHRLPREA